LPFWERKDGGIIEYESDMLKGGVKNEFLRLFSSCLQMLKENSHYIINHFLCWKDLDLGINSDAGIGKEIFLTAVFKYDKNQV
jgi:hypothetical protein